MPQCFGKTAEQYGRNDFPSQFGKLNAISLAMTYTSGIGAENKKIQTWGANPVHVPDTINERENVSIKSFEDITCAIDKEGIGECFGNSKIGNMIPDLSQLNPISAIAFNDEMGLLMCVIKKSDNSILCKEYTHSSGWVARKENPEDLKAEMDIPSDYKARDIAVGYKYICATNLKNELNCWARDEGIARSKKLNPQLFTLGKLIPSTLTAVGLYLCAVNSELIAKCVNFEKQDPRFSPYNTPVDLGRVYYSLPDADAARMQLLLKVKMIPQIN
jgi:hypothetical protein